jgi:hypothetical protein
MKEPRRQQILAAYLGLVVGSELVFAYFLGWQIGVPVACLGLGSALLFYEARPRKQNRDSSTEEKRSGPVG